MTARDLSSFRDYICTVYVDVLVGFIHVLWRIGLHAKNANMPTGSDCIIFYGSLDYLDVND